MSIINRRNAILGYAALKVLERRRKQRKPSAPKLALYLGLGLVSAGILAGLVLLLVRRHRGEPVQPGVDTAVREDSEVADEEDAANPEPPPTA